LGYHFLIQTIDNRIKHDFSFYLLDGIEYRNWYNGTECYTYTLSEKIIRPLLNQYQFYSLKNIVPVGTVEFVHEFLEKYHGIKDIKPINIPEVLMKEEYTKRKVWIINNDKEWFNVNDESLFVKSNTKIKGHCDVINKNQGCPAGEFLISETIDIDSEWRIFVYKNKIVGAQNYLGDFRMTPNYKLIEEMIGIYKDSLPAYTLDIGINDKNGTFILEVHNFYSCGLYGFCDRKILPQMFINTFKYLIKENSQL
jgi:hypothetical protein